MEQQDALQHEVNKVFKIIENATALRQKKQKKSLDVSVRKMNEGDKVLEIAKKIDGPMASIYRYLLWAALLLIISVPLFEGFAYFFRPDLSSNRAWIAFVVLLPFVLMMIRMEHSYSSIQNHTQLDLQLVNQLSQCDRRAVQYVLAHCELWRDKFKRDNGILLFLFPSSTLEGIDWIISLLKINIKLHS